MHRLGKVARMPYVHAPNPSGKLDFGPGNMRFAALPQLLVGKGKVGFELARDHDGPLARFDWNVSVTAARVYPGKRSTLIEKLWDYRKRIRTLGRTHPLRLTFPVGGSPAFYRVSVRFENANGKLLGWYGAYFRVVSRTRDARLGLNSTSYRPGDAVLARVENLGTEYAFYGVPYRIERFDGSAWAIAPESPRGPTILVLLSSPPGQTGDRCSVFSVPATMPAGRYRMSKDVSYGVSFPHDIHRETLTAEFEVAP